MMMPVEINYRFYDLDYLLGLPRELDDNLLVPSVIEPLSQGDIGIDYLKGTEIQNKILHVLRTRNDTLAPVKQTLLKKSEEESRALEMLLSRTGKDVKRMIP